MTLDDDQALAALGFSLRWRALFAPYAEEGLVPGRVVRGDRGSSLVATASGVVRAKPSARLRKAVRGGAVLPAVGDWVALPALDDSDVTPIAAVLDRAGAVARGGSGKVTETQVLAANVDVAFVVHPIADPPNLRRIERELSLVWDSGATPVVALTKADLSADADAARAAVEAIAPGVPVLLMNALAGEGTAALPGYLTDRRTGILIGPSGAGKSTIINALLGRERQATNEVRVSDGRGRHTTVVRELVQLPGGGLLIDTPGLRALVLIGSEEGIGSVFPDIGEAARSCRFRDCTHRDEPGCAVLAAVESGELPAGRLVSYHKLVRESQVAAMKTDARLRAEEERKWKIISKACKALSRRDREG